MLKRFTPRYFINSRLFQNSYRVSSENHYRPALNHAKNPVKTWKWDSGKEIYSNNDILDFSWKCTNKNDTFTVVSFQFSVTLCWSNLVMGINFLLNLLNLFKTITKKISLLKQLIPANCTTEKDLSNHNIGQNSDKIILREKFSTASQIFETLVRWGILRNIVYNNPGRIGYIFDTKIWIRK